MTEINYSSLKSVDFGELLEILNEKSLRRHLIDHPYFDRKSLAEWVESKTNIDKKAGCHVKAVYINGELAGWCGIQPDEKGFEIAIVLSKKFWGFGFSIFKTLKFWAKEEGHKEMLFHLLDSRPRYNWLNKIADRVQKTELAGCYFTTYYFSIDEN